MRIDIDISEITNLNLKEILGKAAVQVNSAGGKALNRIARDTETDTSMLVDSWDITKIATPNNLSTEITTNVEYAPPIEAGSAKMPISADDTYTTKYDHPRGIYTAGTKRKRRPIGRNAIKIQEDLQKAVESIL